VLSARTVNSITTTSRVSSEAEAAPAADALPGGAYPREVRGEATKDMLVPKSFQQL
jgi:hypothetical protein